MLGVLYRGKTLRTLAALTHISARLDWTHFGLLLCFCVVLCVGFCTGNFVMVPLNLSYLHCLQQAFFEYLCNLYSNVLPPEKQTKSINQLF